MRRALLFLPLLALGCGGLKNSNPLQGLAGPVDNTRYGFEASAMGWQAGIAPNPVDQVTQSPLVSFFGSGSLAVHVTNLDRFNPAALQVFPASMPSWTGKTISVWVYLPAVAAPSDSLPDYGQIAAIDGSVARVYANGPGKNLARDGWTKLSWAPLANPSASVFSGGDGSYSGAGFDPATIYKFGLKLGVAGAAGTFTYTGVFYVDGFDW